MHPRVTVNQVSFPKETSLAADLATWARAGAARIGVHRDKLEANGWDESILAVEESQLDVTHLIHRALFDLSDPAGWDASGQAATMTLDAAARLGASCVYITTGSAGTATFEEATSAFADAIAPVVAHARTTGVSLLVETTNPLFADIHFAHTLADTLEVAERAGIGVCFDIQPCWRESRLRDTVRRGAGLIGLVQLSDYIPGMRTLDRALPGDGVVPLEQIVGWTLEDGYEGMFDLELRGEHPEGDVVKVERAGAYAGELLERALGSDG